MNISVIIPTYNEEGVIIDCLTSLDKQSINNFEVIIVDDGSTDDTLKLISDFKLQKYNLTLLQQKHKGPGAARNYGAKHSEGKILVFIDSDMTFDTHFLARLIKPIQELGVKGTFSKKEFVSNWENKWAQCWNINEGWEKGMRHPKIYPDEQKVFRAILASEFEKVGGFTPGGYNDDWSLYEKLGYMAKNAPGAKFYHKNPSSLFEIFRHAMWVGKRKYKLGYFGYLVALGRSSLPFSFLLGLIKSIKNFNPYFLIFKITYDLGIFLGILVYLVSGKASK